MAAAPKTVAARVEHELAQHGTPERADFAKGEGDWDGFVRRADAMLEEGEFFIRKAIGWMLRERGRTRPRDVVAFVKLRQHRIAGLTLREATRNLPPGHRAALDA